MKKPDVTLYKVSNTISSNDCAIGWRKMKETTSLAGFIEFLLNI